MKKLEINNKLVDCTINDICEKVWDNIYADIYADVSFGIYPESDEDWFKLFKDYCDPYNFEISEKEMLDNHDLIIQYGKEYIEKQDSDKYVEAVDRMFDSIAEFEFDDVYMCNPSLREKAKKDAITELYNEYCK